MMSSALENPLIECHQQRDKPSQQCQLQWRQGQLLVKPCQDFQKPYLASIECERWLVECLKHSPARLACIDPRLGETLLNRWADACFEAKKPLFLRRTVTRKLTKKSSQFAWGVNRLIDWILALLLLIGLTPVMLAIVALLYAYSPRAIFSLTWHVGVQGKFFRAIKFHAPQSKNTSRPTQLGRWLCKSRLNELPLLFNVLRGEMSLLGSYPLTLSDAVQLSRQEQEQLNAMPWTGVASGVTAKA